MPYSVVVFLNRDKLPTARALGSYVEQHGFPLGIPEDWDLLGAKGWVPCLWREQESGCELHESFVEPDEAQQLSNAGYHGLDIAYEVVARSDWHSFCVSVTIAASLAVVGEGFISESESEYHSGEEAIDWAQQAVKQAEMEMGREAADGTRESLDEADETLEECVNGLRGQSIKEFIRLDEHFGFSTREGQWVYSNAWKIRASNDFEFGSFRYKSLRNRQIELMTTVSPDELEELETELQDMESGLKNAAKLDRRDIEKLVRVLAGWSENLMIKHADLLTENELQVRLCGQESITVSFFGGGMMKLTVRTAKKSFEIGHGGLTKM